MSIDFTRRPREITKNRYHLTKCFGPSGLNSAGGIPLKNLGEEAYHQMFVYVSCLSSGQGLPIAIFAIPAASALPFPYAMAPQSDFVVHKDHFLSHTIQRYQTEAI